MPFQPGDLILNNRYRIEALIGQGAFGAVYRAAHVELGVQRAVKVLRRDAPGLGSTEFGDYRRRFQLEFQVAAQLDHPHVIKVHDFVEEAGALYAVLELAPGGNLADALKARGPLPPLEVAHLLLDAARGLDALHERDVIHRDVKPSNILLDKDGHAKIADLGLAQVRGSDLSQRSALGSEASRHPGTPDYRSPEHEGYASLLPTSDVYSLGCVAFELLTGKVWRWEQRKTERARDLRPDIPRWLDDCVARMLCETPGLRAADAHDPGKRYVDMRGVSAALETGLAEEERRTHEAAAQRQRELVESRAREEIARKAEAARKQREAAEQAHREATRRAEQERRQQEAAARERRREIWQKVWPWAALAGGVFLLGMIILVGQALFRVWLPTPAPTQVSIATLTLPAPTLETAVPTWTPMLTPTVPLTSTPSLGDCRPRVKDGAQVCYVPAGEFQMGSESGGSDEQPVHTVYLDAFWLDQTEVSVAQFRQFVDATGHETTAEEQGWSYAWTDAGWGEVTGADWAHPEGPGSQAAAQHPVVHVSWDDAAAYCAWAGGRLPTEAEWEYAARGPEGLVYPWGNDFDGARLNYCDQNCPFDWADENVNDGYEFTAPVGSYPGGVSWIGALDLSGNVWEWVADWYGDYPAGRQVNPTGPSHGESRVLRGGSWDSNVRHLRGANRLRYTPAITPYFIGFRCAASWSPGE